MRDDSLLGKKVQTEAGDVFFHWNYEPVLEKRIPSILAVAAFIRTRFLGRATHVGEHNNRNEEIFLATVERVDGGKCPRSEQWKDQAVI